MLRETTTTARGERRKGLRRALTILRGIAVAAMSFVALGGCQSESSGKKKVVVTTGMIADLVENIAQGTVEVQQLMGPGIDPHLYKPKESAIRRLFQADLILYNGLHLEGKMERLLDKNPKAKAVSRNIPPELLLEDEGQHDPHVWFDVGMWLYALDAVEQDLIELCPEHAELYRQNAARYRLQLQSLHEEVFHALSTIPIEQRVLVTAHDAFRYFGRAYLNPDYDEAVVGLQGVSTANQAGLRKVDEVAQLVTDRKIKALFVESSVPPDGVQAVLERCRSRGHTVRIAEEELFSDAMDQRGEPGGTYPGMIWHNVRVIVEALK